MSESKTDLDYMKEATALAIQSVKEKKGRPFGCVIVQDGKIVGKGLNTSLSIPDPTGHGEIVAIRDACRNLSSGILSNCVLYTSSEPCPMCLACIYWARIKKVFFGSSTEDAIEAGFGYDEIYKDIVRVAPEKRSIPHVQVGRDIAMKAFDEWENIQHDN